MSDRLAGQGEALPTTTGPVTGLVPPAPGALPVAAVPAGAVLVTDDLVASASFYRALLGWRFEEGPAPGTLAAVDAGGAGAALLVPAGSGPTGWLPLFQVDTGAVRQRARALGGDVVTEDGWDTVLVDPSGSRVGLVAADDPRAATCSPAGVSIADVGVVDLDAAVGFYGHVMGWGLLPVPDHDYNLLVAGQVPAAGIWEPTGTFTSTLWPTTSDGWQVYLSVSVCERAAAMAMEIGGRLSVPPTDSPVGVFADLVDPRGLPVGVAERTSDEERVSAALSWRPSALSSW